MLLVAADEQVYKVIYVVWWRGSIAHFWIAYMAIQYYSFNTEQTFGHRILFSSQTNPSTTTYPLPTIAFLFAQQFCFCQLCYITSTKPLVKWLFFVFSPKTQATNIY